MEVTLEEWIRKNKLDDEYFHRNDMYWFAELAWKEAYEQGYQHGKQDYEDKTK